MLFICILLLLSSTIAFIPGAQFARKVSILQKDVTTMYSTIEDADVLRTEPEEMFWITPEGLSIEVLAKESTLVIQKQPRVERIYGSVVKLFRRITRNATPEVKSLQKPPILFIHGSFHAAWCFAENYLDFFSARGHHSFAVSLRGTSITGMPPLDPGEVVRIEQHVSDIKSALLSLKSSMSDRAGGMDTPNPIIVSHSFGGLIVMKLLEDEQIRKSISGACFLCSVPPSGNGPMIKRFIKTKFLSSLKIVWGFVFKAVSIDLPNCRELFFDKSVPSADISKYMTKFRADSRVALDLQALGEVLPSITSAGPEGRAVWLPPQSSESIASVIAKRSDSEVFDTRVDMECGTISLYRPAPLLPPEVAPLSLSILVVGAERDFIVDQEGVRETARYLGVKPVFIPGAYHDVMLGPKWRLSADIIADWISTI